MCATALAGLGTAAQCRLPLVTSVCSGLSEEIEVTWTALENKRKRHSLGGHVWLYPKAAWLADILPVGLSCGSAG